MDSIPHTLLIVGKKSGFISGDMNLIKKANTFGERVVMTGFLSDDKLQSYYSHADLFVFPSLYEGFGFPPLEALASRTPVVASNTASIPEVCGDAAIYFDPYIIEDIANKIEQLLANKNLQEKMRVKGIERAKQFSWDKAAKKICKVIEKLLS